MYANNLISVIIGPCQDESIGSPLRQSTAHEESPSNIIFEKPILHTICNPPSAALASTLSTHATTYSFLLIAIITLALASHKIALVGACDFKISSLAVKHLFDFNVWQLWTCAKRISMIGKAVQSVVLCKSKIPAAPHSPCNA